MQPDHYDSHLSTAELDRRDRVADVIGCQADELARLRAKFMDLRSEALFLAQNGADWLITSACEDVAGSVMDGPIDHLNCAIDEIEEKFGIVADERVTKLHDLIGDKP